MSCFRFRPLFGQLLLLAGCAVVVVVAADFPEATEHTLREWHVADGLLTEEVGSIAQDSRGYLWVASTGGVARFDGTVFEAWAPGETLMGMGSFARSMAMVDDGTMLITAGSAGGLAVLREGRYTFEAQPGLGAQQRVAVLYAEQGVAVWAGCTDGTVLRWKEGKAEVFGVAEGLAGKSNTSFATDGERRLWVANGAAVLRYERGRLVPLPVMHGGAQVRIVSSREQGPWIIATNRVLKWTGEKLEEVVRVPELLGAHFIQAALEDRGGRLWIGTRSQGLFRISREGVVHVPTSHEDIYALYEDGEGDIWVGTNGGGLDRLRTKAHRLFEKSAGLRENFSYTVCEDAAGVMWLGNRDGGVVRIAGGEVDVISKRAGWPQFSAMSVSPAPGEGIWVTSGIGVFRTVPGKPDALAPVEALRQLGIVRSTFTTRSGDYWLSSDPDRVARWRNGELKIFGMAEGFDGRDVRGFAEGEGGAVWIGAAEGRLYRCEGERIERVATPGSEHWGAIQAIRVEEGGRLLCGTSLGGLVGVWPGASRGARVLGVENGLPNENVTQILTDDAGRYWFSSLRGIFRISRSELLDYMEGRSERVHAIVLGKDDGVQELSSLGMFQPSAWKARDGKLWFATRRGMLRVDPALATDDVSPPPVVITGVKCDGRAQPLAMALEVPAGARKIEIAFSVLSLSAPERLQVRYRLDGFDNDWVVQTTGRLATYPRLPAGRYVFRAMASNGSGIWNDRGLALSLSVVPPWWQRTWANLLYLGALIAVVALVARAWSHRRLRSRLERLERESAIERERTRIAQNIHDDLGASLTRISLLTQCADGESPAGAANLDKIYQTAADITRAMDEIVWAVNPKYDDVDSLVYYLGNFAQNFLSGAGIRCRLDVAKDLPRLGLTSQTRHSLFLCCKEALNNVVKHAGAGEVTIALEADAGCLTVKIADNGGGFAQAGPAGVATGNVNRVSSGNGLVNMRRRLVEMGGRCEIAAGSPSGTVVVFTVPLAAMSS